MTPFGFYLRTNLVFCLLALALAGNSVQNANAAPRKDPIRAVPSANEVLQKTSLAQLEQFSSYLAALSKEDDSAKTGNAKSGKKARVKVLKCDPSAKQVKLWESTVKSLIDNKLGNAQDFYLKVKPEARAKFFADCEKDCSCQANLEVVSSLDAKKLTPSDQTLMTELKAKKVSPDCEAAAHKPTWYCGSDLQSYLKAID